MSIIRFWGCLLVANGTQMSPNEKQVIEKPHFSYKFHVGSQGALIIDQNNGFYSLLLSHGGVKRSHISYNTNQDAAFER